MYNRTFIKFDIELCGKFQNFITVSDQNLIGDAALPGIVYCGKHRRILRCSNRDFLFRKGLDRLSELVKGRNRPG